MNTEELMEQVRAAQAAAVAKEIEWRTWISKHDIPHELRDLLIEWDESRNKVSRLVTELSEAYAQREAEFEARREEAMQQLDNLNGLVEGLRTKE